MKFLITLLAGAIIGACQSFESKPESETPKTDTMSTAATPNTLSEEEKAEGWELLFDGISKKGWHSYLNRSDGSAWKVENGAFFFDPGHKVDGKPAGRGDLVTDEEYENFHLKLEWKISKGGNSGIIFYVKEDPKYQATYVTGPEMQVLDNDAHADAKIHKHRAGDLYDLIAAEPETVKPVGEWNKVEIISKNGNLEFHLNGVKVVSTTMWDENWKQMIANSKFKGWADFGVFKKGRIALQDHGDPVWYRNIKIKKLK
jgi:hypothetical protein